MYVPHLASVHPYRKVVFYCYIPFIAGSDCHEYTVRSSVDMDGGDACWITGVSGLAI